MCLIIFFACSVYVEVVLNHMTENHPSTYLGTDGTKSEYNTMDYPAVPYNVSHFHAPCDIKDWNNLDEVSYMFVQRQATYALIKYHVHT